MPSSLGIYIEDNLIKYAKVAKEKDQLKVEAYNVMFYENNLAEALNKIVSETYSFKVPICVNASNEIYNYYDVFSGLSEKDVKKSIDLEFESTCNEKNYNKNSLESRFVLISNRENTDRVKALHVAVNKTDIDKKLRDLSGTKVTSVSPISSSITNLLSVKPSDNVAIVNIEDQTKITTIVEGQIYRVDTLEYGMGQILDAINKTENSMQKSYDVCKNVTIYTQETQGLQAEENEHLEDVMPVLYKIVTESKKIIDSAFANISKVYITGLGTAINNIDLYFQEYMVNVKCEILRPFFAESGSVKIPIKDYIEVNSAIALALNGLGYENKSLNFVSGKSMLTTGNVDFKVIGSKIVGSFKNFNFSLTGPLSFFEKTMMRLIVAAWIAVLCYTAFATQIEEQIEAKTEEVNTEITAANAEISKIDTNYSTINTRTNTYISLINTINNLSNSSEDTTETTERVIAKDAIPNLLNRIMFVIPQQVQITSIQNTSGTHIVIEAQSEKYEQLGYFKAILDTKGYLTDVKSSSGTKESGVVKVTIEGELP